jgi:hypothetical protein
VPGARGSTKMKRVSRKSSGNKDRFMYKIIGADHREYGPVSAERIRQWILAGRVNAQSRIQADGGAWQSVGDLAEFGEVLKVQAAATPPPPRIASTEADRMAAAIIARDYLVDIGEWFSRAWRLVLEELWLLAGATAVILVLAIGMISFPVIGTVAIVLLGFVLWGGLGWLFLKRIRGQRADMGDAFAGFALAFVPLMLGGLVIQALTTVGLALCIVPGVYLVVIWWGFAPLLIIDKRLDFWPAMELSRKVVNAHWWQVAALTLCVVAVGLSGLLLFGVGIFLTLPLALAALVYAYEDIFGKLDAGALPPAASAQAMVTTRTTGVTAETTASPQSGISGSGAPPKVERPPQPENPLPEDRSPQS